jgi:hypothetical protein
MTRALALVERMLANLHAQTEKPDADGLIADDRGAGIDCGTPLCRGECNDKPASVVRVFTGCV